MGLEAVRSLLLPEPNKRQVKVYGLYLLVSGLLTTSTYPAVYSSYANGLNEGSRRQWWFRTLNGWSFLFSLATIAGSFALSLVLTVTLPGPNKLVFRRKAALCFSICDVMVLGFLVLMLATSFAALIVASTTFDHGLSISLYVLSAISIVFSFGLFLLAVLSDTTQRYIKKVEASSEESRDWMAAVVLAEVVLKNIRKNVDDLFSLNVPNSVYPTLSSAGNMNAYETQMATFAKERLEKKYSGNIDLKLGILNPCIVLFRQRCPGVELPPQFTSAYYLRNFLVDTRQVEWGASVEPRGREMFGIVKFHLVKAYAAACTFAEAELED